MYLVQLLLPLYDNHRQPFGRAAFDRVRNELTERFGGATAFLRAPAEGVWQTEDGAVSRDEIVIFEVMTGELDRAWWARYRAELACRFRQEELIIRASEVEQL
jgi:hypothetical protein